MIFDKTFMSNIFINNLSDNSFLNYKGNFELENFFVKESFLILSFDNITKINNKFLINYYYKYYYNFLLFKLVGDNLNFFLKKNLKLLLYYYLKKKYINEKNLNKFFSFHLEYIYLNYLLLKKNKYNLFFFNNFENFIKFEYHISYKLYYNVFLKTNCQLLLLNDSFYSNNLKIIINYNYNIKIIVLFFYFIFKLLFVKLLLWFKYYIYNIIKINYVYFSTKYKK